MRKLKNLKELVFETDNNACFIERDEILGRLETEMAEYSEPDKFAIVFSRLLSEVSVPINENDYFAGRVVEALPYEGLKTANRFLCSEGHLSPDYEKILRCGLKGIVFEINDVARKKGDPESEIFAKNAIIVAEAIRDYCLRYAEKARQMGFEAMAKALRTVPYEPAYDFYSALQGIWILHMVLSCYIGARDYAFGNFDQYMLPFYESALINGQTEAELTELLAGFFIKTNEICGRCTHNYNKKPILCQSSKQYLNIGGDTPNRFSIVCLKDSLKNKYVFGFFVALYIGATCITYSDWWSLVLMVAQFAGAYSLMFRSGKFIRNMRFFFVSPIWLINNTLMCFTLGGTICEIITMTSIIVSFIRYRKTGFEA